MHFQHAFLLQKHLHNALAETKKFPSFRMHTAKRIKYKLLLGCFSYFMAARAAQ